MVKFSGEKGNIFVASFDAGLFHEDQSGLIELRFKTESAHPFLNELNKLHNI